MTIRVPDGVAAWLHGQEEVTGFELDIAQFPVVVPGREYRSADYETARNRVDLKALSTAGSIRIV